MNPNKALWEKGDFTRIADTMRESGEARPAHWYIKRPQGSGPWLRRWHDGNTRGEARSGCAGRRYREELG